MYALVALRWSEVLLVSLVILELLWSKAIVASEVILSPMWSQVIVQQSFPTVTLGRSCTNAIQGTIIAQQWEPSDRAGPIRCSLLMLEHEEWPKICAEHNNSCALCYCFLIFNLWIFSNKQFFLPKHDLWPLQMVPVIPNLSGVHELCTDGVSCGWLCDDIITDIFIIFVIVTMGWDYVSVELLLLMDPLSILQMIHEWIWSVTGMILAGENWRTRIKTCPSDTLSTTNLTRTALGANPGHHGEKLMTNCLSYIMAPHGDCPMWLNGQGIWSFMARDSPCAFNVTSICRTWCSSSCEVTILLSDFNQNWNVSINFIQTPKYRMPWKSA
jgi:hypothetical protein